MLTHLQIRDFAIVDRIAIDLGSGMTVLTGETGAGKSILVDAVGLVLGERGGSQLVRGGAKRAEFSAAFDIASLPDVQQWLAEQALDQDDDCLLRRVVNADGRSRAFINGNAATMQQLKSLGEMLLDIHGQHFHQSLARRTVQRDLLDHFGDLGKLRDATAAAYTQWQSVTERLQRLVDADADRASRIDLLAFQLQELDALEPSTGEFASLQAERQKLRHGSALAEGIAATVQQLAGDDTPAAAAMIADAARTLQSLQRYDDTLAPILEMLESAGIQVAETTAELARYMDDVDLDPDRRDWVEERLDALQTVARKHRTDAESLPELRDRLRGELDELQHAEERGRELEVEVKRREKAFRHCAGKLTAARAKSADGLSHAVTGAMEGLGMPGGSFTVEVRPSADGEAHAWGVDEVEFLISANPGQPPMPLARVASGGELSRMSLAIQVIVSDGSAIPTMIFDEVDSGVGGRVAEMVGRRLQELGDKRQVLCVTHLPQVASLADRHYRVSKVSDGKTTHTRIQELDKNERVDELARMLGGVEITQKTIEHAAEMLAVARQKRA